MRSHRFARDLDRHITREPADALTDDHAQCAACGALSSVIDADGRCPDCPADPDAELDADPTFAEVCDARRDAWLDRVMEEPDALPGSLAWCSVEERVAMGWAL